MACEDEEDRLIVEWDDKYSVKIPFIDEQHKKLIEQTNTLYQGCLSGTEEEKAAYFMETVKSVVEYTKFHFTAEEKMLQYVSYPQLEEHKRQHEEFVQKLIDEVRGFQNGGKLAPNNFVRFLRDWILSHIAMEDTRYARYIFGLKKAGTLDARLHIGEKPPSKKPL